MYSKFIVFICAAAIASAGQIYQDNRISYGSYALPVATSHQRFSIDTSSRPVVTRTVATPVAYEATPVTYVAPAVESYHQISKPAVSSQSVNLHSFNPTPIVSRTYAPRVATYAVPAVATYSAPAVSYPATARVAYATPAPAVYATTAPVAYSAVPGVIASHAAYSSYARSYSAAPAVSHVSYSGLNAKYEW